MHLLIPHAAPSPAQVACRCALGALQLPHLQALLNRLTPDTAFGTEDDSHTPAFERAHAQALGLPHADGLVPWAALAAREAGLPHEAHYALCTPCHWDIHTHSVFMADPAELALGEEESHALRQAMQPYFEEDGLLLHPLRADTWLLAGAVLRDLPTASLERVRHASVDDWTLRQPSARPLQRLLNEMQMLLYNHPVNLAREARGAVPVNAFWLSGTGSLPPHWQPSTPAVVVDARLRAPALHDDAHAWATAWQALEQGPVRHLLDAATRGQPVRLTLASATQARSLHTAPRPLWSRLRQRWSPLNASTFLQTL